MANQGARSGKASRRTSGGGTGRVTPKGTVPKRGRPRGAGAEADPTRRATAAPSGRYTPPVRKEVRVSPRWVPVLMFSLLALGVLVIILNYMEVLPGASDNRYLLGGLAAITAGFVTATQYR